MNKSNIFEILIFQNCDSHLLPGEGVERKISGYRCHFFTFQLELDNLGTKNFEISSVVKKIPVRLFEVGEILVKS